MLRLLLVLLGTLLASPSQSESSRAYSGYFHVERVGSHKSSVLFDRRTRRLIACQGAFEETCTTIDVLDSIDVVPVDGAGLTHAVDGQPATDRLLFLREDGAFKLCVISRARLDCTVQVDSPDLGRNVRASRKGNLAVISSAFGDTVFSCTWASTRSARCSSARPFQTLENSFVFGSYSRTSAMEAVSVRDGVVRLCRFGPDQVQCSPVAGLAGALDAAEVKAAALVRKAHGTSLVVDSGRRVSVCRLQTGSQWVFDCGTSSYERPRNARTPLVLAVASGASARGLSEHAVLPLTGAVSTAHVRRGGGAAPLTVEDVFATALRTAHERLERKRKDASNLRQPTSDAGKSQDGTVLLHAEEPVPRKTRLHAKRSLVGCDDALLLKGAASAPQQVMSSRSIDILPLEQSRDPRLSTIGYMQPVYRSPDDLDDDDASRLPALYDVMVDGVSQLLIWSDSFDLDFWVWQANQTLAECLESCKNDYEAEKAKCEAVAGIVTIAGIGATVGATVAIVVTGPGAAGVFVAGVTVTTTMAGALLMACQGNAAARWASCQNWARRNC